ncbi:hypothetical protein V5739_09420 [Salinimicrobium sp. TIG7-5_MAKvit]|uniref:hypothetical protein n=1 Tax=Salinimicrobium sp. TIG7-5_MAKvit TaxID=3121289 RepID=UPI003C6DC30C
MKQEGEKAVGLLAVPVNKDPVQGHNENCHNSSCYVDFIFHQKMLDDRERLKVVKTLG